MSPRQPAQRLNVYRCRNLLPDGRKPSPLGSSHRQRTATATKESLDDQPRQHPADDTSPNTTPTKVSVVIPALNEERNLPFVAARMPTGIDEVVFVNGDHRDRTAEVALELWPDGIHVRQTRKGKGNALACGLAAATGDIIVMIDADGSTDPAEIPGFCFAR